MAQSDDFKTLRGLKPFAQTLIDLEGIFERGMSLKATITAMEKRKAEVQKELADLLASVEQAKQSHASVAVEASNAIDALRAQRQAEQDGLREDRATRAKAAGDDARDYKKRQEAFAAQLREENERLRAENKSLRGQREALQKDLDETLSRYTAARK